MSIRTRKSTFVACVAAALALATASTAGAAVVSVSETLLTQTKAELAYSGATGEVNEVDVAFAGQGDEFFELEVVDATAPLAPGAGCTGGGAPGTPAHCLLRKPKSPQYTGCGKLCWTPVPGTGIYDALRIELGDEGDALAVGLEGSPLEGIEASITGGAGADRIRTSVSQDTVQPGPGNDEVDTGRDADRVVADAQPDGDDSINLGDKYVSGDIVDYSLRSTPVYLAGTVAGATGEHDALSYYRTLIGGQSNDVLETSDVNIVLTGEAGDDLLAGGSGDDRLFGGLGADRLRGGDGNDELHGGSGDDAYEGGNGTDNLDEHFQQPGSEFIPTDGNDSADGGPGDDHVNLGVGDDRIEGGPGVDAIISGEGDDEASGGDGSDTVSGGGGRDKLQGGAGSDLILAGHLDEELEARLSQIDSWRDEVDCGPDADVAVINRWDTAASCEKTTTLRIARFGRPRQRSSGIAVLPIDVVGPGHLVVQGPGLKRVSRQIEAGPPLEGTHSALVPLAARGKVSKALKRRGHVTTKLWLRFVPKGGIAREETKRVKLVRAGRRR